MLFLFDNFVLDVERRELRCGDELRAMEPQVFDILEHLVRNRDRVVSKDNMLAAVWNGRIVSDATLASRVSAARNALGDNGRDQKFIRTMIGKGIRFVADAQEEQEPSPVHREPLVRGPSLSDRPSIAVLPFQNMSGDPEQEYFADGVAEDLLTTLSRIHDLMVIARNSSFVFKGQTRDIREIGKILGARYVLEGSVRRVGNRVRLTAQLIDSQNGSHLWADRYDGIVDDIFDLQDRITQEIVAALEVQLTFGEQARVWRKRSGSPLVYEYFLKGRGLYVHFARRTHAQAREQFERALEINPAFLPALYLLGLTLTDQARFGWEKDQAATFEAALDCANRALGADPGYGEAYLVIGYVRNFQRRHGDAVAAGEKAIALSPNGSDAYHMAGMYHGYAGNFRKAALYEEHAQRLCPLERNESMVDEARAKFHLGDFVAARDIALRVLTERPRWLTARSILIAALWNLGREDHARSVAKELLTSHPEFSIGRWTLQFPYRRLEDLDTLINPLRMAGLPG